jgi:hypothetical protein
MTGYWKPIEVGSSHMGGCLNCGPRAGVLRYKDDPSPGFGIVSIRRDDETVDGTCGGAATMIRRWRSEARRDPNHVWVIEVDGPLSGTRYQRQPNGRWLATHQSMGFA